MKSLDILGAVLAHQGGWDEILLVVGPLAVVGGVLWVANRRVTAQLQAAELQASEAGGPGGGDDPGPTGGSDGTGDRR